jgi:hypothetical protein
MNAIPRQWDTKIVVSKLNGEPDASGLSPIFETMLLMSRPLPFSLPRPLGPSLPPEEVEAISKVEEKQPVDTAVSKVATSVVRCSLMSQAASAPPKSKPTGLIQSVSSIPGGYAPKLAHSQQVAPCARPGIKPWVVRDKMLTETANKQPHVACPDAAPPGGIPSSWVLSSRTDASKRHNAVSVVAEDKGSVPLPGARTVPTMSEPSPVHPTQAHSISLIRKEPKRHVKDAMKEEMREGSPAPRVALSLSACPQPDRDKRHSPVKIIRKVSGTNVLLGSPVP